MKLYQYILNAFKSVADFIIKELEEMSARHEQQQQAIRYQQFCTFNNQVAEQLRKELFELFTTAPYQFLNRITIQSEIMFLKWQVYKGQTVFTFQMNADPMPALAVLKQCLHDMEMIISQYQQNLVMTMGYVDAELLYPCIINGLRIMNIRRVGCMVQFDITVNAI